MLTKRLTLALVTLPLLLACGPLVVRADAGGSQKLPLPGEQRVQGVVTRALSYNGLVVPEGTLVSVEETWLLRHDRGAKPPGYRITGLYDPTTQTDGLALPKHSVEAFYLSAILPEQKTRVAVPVRYFKRE